MSDMPDTYDIEDPCPIDEICPASGIHWLECDCQDCVAARDRAWVEDDDEWLESLDSPDEEW